ncbi:hypothetical protein ACIBU0_34265 [Streptomyces sp. NPDC049627]|uniref:hypothetical protein n=1 Tax=Streptomyces sp. NPDC049627 TaxID=3365595 RepID=UPI00378BB6CB
MQSLLDILAPDVVFLGDGDGVVQATLQPAQVNGRPTLGLRLDGAIDTVPAVRIDDGLITGLYAVR